MNIKMTVVHQQSIQHEEIFYAPPRSQTHIAGVAFYKTSDSGAPGPDAALQPVLPILQ